MIEDNKTRDLHNESALRDAGWHVVTIWECALKTKRNAAWLEKRLPRLIGG